MAHDLQERGVVGTTSPTPPPAVVTDLTERAPGGPVEAARLRLRIAERASSTPVGMPLAADPSHARNLAQELGQARAQLHYEELNESLEGKLRPGALGFGEGGSFRDNELRNDFARSNEFAEIQAKFHNTYPDGAIIQYPLSGDQGFTVLFKRNNNDKFWQEVDPPGLESGSVGEFMGTLFSEPIAGAILGTFVAPVYGTAIGAAIGKGTQDSIEALRGYQVNTVGQIAVGMLIEGLIAGGGDAVVLGAAKAIPAVTGANPARIFRANEEAIKASQAAHLEGLPPLLIAQAAESDLLRYSFSQAAGLGSRFAKQALINQEKALLSKLERLSSRSYAGLDASQKAVLLGLRAKELDSMVTRPVTSDIQVGRAFERSVTNFQKRSKQWVNDGYANPNITEANLTFTLRYVHKELDDILQGVPTRARPNEGYIASTRNINTQAEYTGEFGDLLARIKEANPTITNLTTETKQLFRSFEQMKSFRTQLYDFRFDKDPNVRRAATRLHIKIQAAMENPMRGGNKEFQLAWRTASLRHRFRERMLERAYIRRTINTDTPERLVAQFVAPGQSTALRVMKRVMPDEEFQIVRDGFKARLMDRSQTPDIARALKRWKRNPETLNMLISPQERRALLEWESASKRWEQGAGKILGDETLNTFDTVAAMLKADGGVLDDLIRVSSGGKNSQQAVALRAGMYRRMLDDASYTNQAGTRVMDASKLNKLVNEARSSHNFDAFMRKQDWERLDRLDIYTAIIRAGPDVGGEMQRASVAAALKNPLKLGTFLGAVRTVGTNSVVGRMLAADATTDILMQAAGRVFDVRKLRAAAAASTVAFVEMSNSRYATRRIPGQTGVNLDTKENFRNRNIGIPAP
jgi:hypothetical protein